MPTYKRGDNVFYQGRKAEVLSLSESGKRAFIQYHTQGGTVHTHGWLTRWVRIGSISKKPPTNLSRAQSRALLILLDSEQKGIVVTWHDAIGRRIHPGTSGWLFDFGYIGSNYEGAKGGKMVFSYHLTNSGRKLAESLARLETEDRP